MTLIYIFLFQLIASLFVYQLLKRHIAKSLKDKSIKKELEEVVVDFNQKADSRVTEFQNLTKQFKDTFFIAQKSFSEKEAKLKNLLESLEEASSKSKRDAKDSIDKDSKKEITNTTSPSKLSDAPNATPMIKKIPESNNNKPIKPITEKDKNQKKSLQYVKKNNKLVPRESLSISEQIFTLHNQGLSIHQISKQTNLTAMEVNFYLSEKR